MSRRVVNSIDRPQKRPNYRPLLQQLALFVAALFGLAMTGASNQASADQLKTSIVLQRFQTAAVSNDRQDANVLIAQLGDSDYFKDETPEETDNRKAREEQARLAPTCNPLKDKAASILQTAGTAVGPFNKALGALQDLTKQLPGACPPAVQTFSGTIVDVVYCYNQAIYVRLADGSAYVWTARTRVFDYGRPETKREFIMGLTDAPYYCLKSVSPIVIYTAFDMLSIAKRPYDPSDEARITSDQTRARARAKVDAENNIAGLNQKISAAPNDADSVEARGNAFLKAGNYPAAINDFDQYLALRPTDPIGWNNACWARALANTGLQDALADCDKALQLKSNDANFLDSRGLVYFRLAQYDKSIADFDAALNLNPKLPTSLYGRGMAKLRNGDRAGGEADVAAAKQLKTDIVDDFVSYGIK